MRHMKPSTPILVLLLLGIIVMPRVQAHAVEFSRTKLQVVTQAGKQFPFTVELAETPEQREQGLMYRDSIPDDGGMLFLFPKPQVATFWMRNTFIGLDILFVARDGRIVNIHERAVPGSLAIISAAGPVTAVLELRAGLTGRLGIRAGDRVVHPAFQ